jgi:hypothetical protein
LSGLYAQSPTQLFRECRKDTKSFYFVKKNYACRENILQKIKEQHLTDFPEKSG